MDEKRISEWQDEWMNGWMAGWMERKDSRERETTC